MISIGLIGTNGAGKSVACDYFRTQGYEVISLSDVIRQEVQNQGLVPDRDTLLTTSNAMKAKFGLDILARRVVEMVRANAWEHVAFDSVRHPLEIDYLKSMGTRMLGIDAPIELRYARIRERQKATDGVDFETFKKQDERERNGSSSGQNISASLQACDRVIQNDGSYEDLIAKLAAFLNSH